MEKKNYKCANMFQVLLHYFVVSRAHDDFAVVTLSVKSYQELIEVDTVAHIFKNDSFEDDGCTSCHKPHKSLECPSLRSIIEMEVSSSTTTGDSSSSSSENSLHSPAHDSRPWRQTYGDRSRSYSRSPNRYDRGNSDKYEKYDDRCINYRPRSGDRFYPNQYDHPR